MASATRSLGDTLDFDDPGDGGLTGFVPATAYNNHKMYAKYLGLGTEDNVKAWMLSPQFKPFFEDYYNAIILPCAAIDSSSTQGAPQLEAIKTQIMKEERRESEHYTGYNVDIKDFNSMD